MKSSDNACGDDNCSKVFLFIIELINLSLTPPQQPYSLEIFDTPTIVPIFIGRVGRTIKALVVVTAVTDTTTTTKIIHVNVGTTTITSINLLRCILLIYCPHHYRMRRFCLLLS